MSVIVYNQYKQNQSIRGLSYVDFPSEMDVNIVNGEAIKVEGEVSIDQHKSSSVGGFYEAPIPVKITN